ncbi:hypothetical protein NDU88_001201 [Pleurodeles waltl]|uniref:Uncharacterized protein n=1 Tax=Pleurodeles waltl TaxID=8319 RepID=A0AAV7WL33_PLEWA|nr:hypothetical protein NDU88_001201 [Pleurodeles waltl]
MLPAQLGDLCSSDTPTGATPRRDLSLASGAVSYSTTRRGNLPAAHLQASASAATLSLGLSRLAPARSPRASPWPGVHNRSRWSPPTVGSLPLRSGLQQLPQGVRMTGHSPKNCEGSLDLSTDQVSAVCLKLNYGTALDSRTPEYPKEGSEKACKRHMFTT